MTKRPSKTPAKGRGRAGDDAVDVLLAALGSRPAKSADSSSTISSKKTKRSAKKRKSTKKRSPAAEKTVEIEKPVEFTETDIRLRMMVAESEPNREYTLQEIADYVGVSRERIRQLEFQALKSLRFHMARILKKDNLDKMDLLKNEHN